jgi:2-keto-4-pentenoate hydratase
MSRAQAAAEALEAARRAGGLRPVLAPGISPADVAEGAAAQHRLAALRGDLPPGGFKLGATGRRMQDYLGLTGPAAGYMAQADIHPTGARLSWGALFRPGVECELAVRLGSDLPPGPCTRAQARNAVAALSAAIEVVENRYADLAAFGTPALIADQVFHRAAVIGPPATDTALIDDICTLSGALTVDLQERGSGPATELLGDPLNGLAWLAASDEAAAFGGLHAGQWVMLGSVCPPVWLDAPGTVRVAFGRLAHVSVTFA